MRRHEIEVYEERQYWWRCATCGDEGGPFEMWEFAHDSAIGHSIRADEPENSGTREGRDD